MAGHFHDDHELAWVIRGSVLIDTEDGRWEVTPTRSVWVPAGVDHQVTRTPDSLILLALIPPSAGADPLGRVASVERSAELAVHAEALLQPQLVTMQVRHAAYRGILEALPRHAHAAGPLALPSDPLARTVAEQLFGAPDTRRSLAEWAEALHISSKTLQRRFVEETGLTFSLWRRRARLLAADALLREGLAVAAVATRVGFAGASAFIQAYKAEFGATPGRRYSSNDAAASDARTIRGIGSRPRSGGAGSRRAAS